MMKKNIRWMLPLLTCLVVSVASLFLPVLRYKYPSGHITNLNILDFIKPEELNGILNTYSGALVIEIPRVVVTILAVCAALSIIVAFAGVITMSRQRPNTWQFIMTLAGMVGTAVPSVLILLAVVLSVSFFPGSFRPGVYSIVTPVTMALCMVTVTKKHKKTQAELRAEERAKGLIRPGGDL